MNNLKNRVQLIGYLGMDPEVKELENGRTVSRFSVATSESYRNGNGVRVTDTHWHRIVAWGNVAELTRRLLKKGSEVAFEGKLAQNVYEDKDGIRRYTTDIVISEFLLISRVQATETA